MNNLILSEKAKPRPYITNEIKFNLNTNELDKIIGGSNSNNLIDILVSTYVKKGNLLFDKSLFNQAFECYSKIIDVYDTFSIKDASIIRIYNRLAECKIKTLCYEEALSYLCECYSYAINLEDKSDYNNCMFNMALTYKKLKDFDNALLYSNKYLDSLDINKHLNKYIEISILKCNCFVGKNFPNNAITLCSKLITNFGDKLGKYKGHIYDILGNAYIQKNNREIALKYFNKALYFKSINDRSTLCHSLINMSNIYIYEGSYKKAIDILNNGLILAAEYYDNEYLFNGYLALERVYKNLNNYEELKYIYMHMLETLKDVDTCLLMDIYIKLSSLKPQDLDYSKLNDIFHKSKFFTII